MTPTITEQCNFIAGMEGKGEDRASGSLVYSVYPVCPVCPVQPQGGSERQWQGGKVAEVKKRLWLVVSG